MVSFQRLHSRLTYIREEDLTFVEEFQVLLLIVSGVPSVLLTVLAGFNYEDEFAADLLTFGVVLLHCLFGYLFLCFGYFYFTKT